MLSNKDIYELGLETKVEYGHLGTFTVEIQAYVGLKKWARLVNTRHHCNLGHSMKSLLPQ